MEVTSSVHRGQQPSLSQIVDQTLPDSNVSKAPTIPAQGTDPGPVPRPDFSLNIQTISKPAENVTQNNTNVPIDQMEKVQDAEQRKDKVERRVSNESVEKFLANSIMSPGVTTPRDDPGFSRVPGYTPEATLSSLSEDSEEPEALKLALSGETSHLTESSTDPNDEHTPVNENASVEMRDTSSELNASKPVESSSAPETNRSHFGSEVMMRERPDMKSPTGIGARPKDPSAMKKSRPNSLLGLSTPDLNLQPPIPMPAEDGSTQAWQEPNPSLEQVTSIPQQDSEMLGQDQPGGHIKPARDGLTLNLGQPLDSSQMPNIQNRPQSLTGSVGVGEGILSPEQHMESVHAGHTPHQPHPPGAPTAPLVPGYLPGQTLTLPPPGTVPHDPTAPVPHPGPSIESQSMPDLSYPPGYDGEDPQMSTG